VIDATTESFVFELTGKSDKIDQFVVLMRRSGSSKSRAPGICAISRGPEGM
jgi:acetolactate synthase I/III small subunit